MNRRLNPGLKMFNPRSRRSFLKGLASTVALASAGPFRSTPARAANGVADRVIFFYFPDGVPGWSQNGDPTLWNASGDEYNPTLPTTLSPLEPWKHRCVFPIGLSMGGTDSGSHPGGAKKLLTGVDGGGGWSINHYLGQTVGSGSPFRHLYLGAMANQNNAGGDKHITYVDPGTTVPPEDNPLTAFSNLFGTGAPVGGGGGETGPDLDVSVVDGVLAEMNALKQKLGQTEAGKVDFHLQSLQEVEQRIKSSGMPVDPPAQADCDNPSVHTSGVEADQLYNPERFPDILQMQCDLMVNAMACGLTRVGTIQCSHHTSDLIMSRFPGTEMYTPGYDMRSHQASHYGASHDWSKMEFSHFVMQRRYWVSQLVYLMEQLEARPEGEGTMLDNTLLVLCTEVSDGNTHSHDDMGFILAGGAGGAWSTGRVMQLGYRRHSDLLVSIARAMGQDITSYGQDSSGPIPGLAD